MPGISAVKIGIPLSKKSGINWSAYWTTRHPELGTYITGLTTPLSEAQIIRLGEFLEALKTGMSIASLSDVFDVMYVLAGETAESSLKNLVKDDSHCTNIHATAFVAFEGYTGDGANDYLDTDYNPTADADNYSLNDAGFGFYSRTDKTETSTDFGVETGINARCKSLIRYATNDQQLNVNAAALSGSNTGTDSTGLFIGQRTAAGALALYRNNSLLFDGATASNSIPNNKFYICACGDDGTADEFSTRQISFAFIGKSLSAGQREALTDAFEAYMDANGKGVIP